VTRAVSAELRSWTRTSGNVVEASLVSAQGAGVVLKEPDGTTLQIGKDSLSQADPDYFSGR